MFSSIKVGDNNPNVFLNSATTSKSVILIVNVLKRGDYRLEM